MAELVNFEPVTIDGKTICHVTCRPSKRDEVWLKPDRNSPERFYVRFGPSSTELQPREALAYIQDAFSRGARGRTPVMRMQSESLRITVVAWGSLLWDQRTLQLASRWYLDGPRLPLEFARVSSDGRLTFVVHEGSALQRTYWAASSFDSLTGARENLRVREGCPTVAPIHILMRSGETQGEVPESIKRVMAAWLSEHTEIDAVVWSGLKPKRIGARAFSVETAVLYLRCLEEPARSKAREYVTKAPPQIQTPVRQHIREALGWKDEPLPPNTLEPPNAH